MTKNILNEPLSTIQLGLPAHPAFRCLRLCFIRLHVKPWWRDLFIQRFFRNVSVHLVNISQPGVVNTASTYSIMRFRHPLLLQTASVSQTDYCHLWISLKTTHCVSYIFKTRHVISFPVLICLDELAGGNGLLSHASAFPIKSKWGGDSWLFSGILLSAGSCCDLSLRLLRHVM